MMLGQDSNTLKCLIIGSNDFAIDFEQFLSQNKFQVDSFYSIDDLSLGSSYDLVFLFVEDDLQLKSNILSQLKNSYPDALLTCSIEGIDLSTIQDASKTNVIGLNFSYPVKSSPFMEIIRTQENADDSIHLIQEIGLNNWKLDPYISNNISARNYMLAAMTREAMNLVDKGYATAESIDRACRNDAGYYLPFTGNFLYMDLMGTIAYALVMKDLNPELSKSSALPNWFTNLVETGKLGMKENQGIYTYQEGDYEAWRNLMQDFSSDIAQVITKYKKNYE